MFAGGVVFGGNIHITGDEDFQQRGRKIIEKIQRTGLLELLLGETLSEKGGVLTTKGEMLARVLATLDVSTRADISTVVDKIIAQRGKVSKLKLR